MSNRVEMIVHSKHRIDPTLVSALDEEDVRELTAIALAEGDTPERVAAMNALAAARGRNATAPLVRVLRDRTAPQEQRACAASLLGRVGGVEAERALVGTLEDDSVPNLLRIKLAAALGRAGGPEAIGVLQRLADRVEGAALEQVRFSISEIAYRHEMTDYLLSEPSRGDLLEAPGEPAAAVRLERASPELLARALASLAPDAHGLRLSPTVGWTALCGKQQLLVALDADVSHDLPAALSGLPRLLGVVAERSPEDGSYSTKWLILSWPSEGGRFQFAIHRPSGRRMFYGTGATSGAETSFEVRAAPGPGAAPVLVSGRVAADQVQFHVATVGAARPRRTPVPLRPQ